MSTILDQIEAQNRATLRTIIDGLSGAESVQRMLNGRGAIDALQSGINVSAAIQQALQPQRDALAGIVHQSTVFTLHDAFTGVGRS